MGVGYSPTIIQAGRAHIKFGLEHYQALEYDGLLQRWPRVQLQIDLHLQIQSFSLIFM